ncbi:hypothetical protein L3X38_027661 [Prunus dulcis]|uniref:Integrase catalytic domain-containing protein n=1 Tax=Prunus dulcis TaxID=3755 RepID=A0AAD4VPW4_PRUDU|nr:hypothetical protein L3X38_027661 [Prunus dulcis]
MNIVSSCQTTASTSPSSKIATIGSHGYVLHSSSKKHIWVIDIGATDHMTFDPGQITSHTPSSQLVVFNANGTPSPDILSSKTIGCGTRRGKLYYLDLASDSEASLNHAYKIRGTSVEKQTSEISLLQTKGEVSSKFQQFYHMVETQFHARIQVLQYDNGGEFLNHDLNKFLQDHGIIHQRSCPYTPQQNGMAERKNRHLLEVVRASLFGANMPRSFWGEAILSATYLINRIPSSILNFQTPLQTLYHHIQIPPTKNLEPRIFGCVVFVHLHDHQRSKLDPRAEKCIGDGVLWEWGRKNKREGGNGSWWGKGGAERKSEVGGWGWGRVGWVW